MDEIEDELCICSHILQHILQTGELNVTYLMKLLLGETRSVNGQFFQVQTKEQRYLCRYSTQATFVQGQEYMLQDLPFEQITVMHKASPIALIVIDNQDEFDNWSIQERQRTLDAICLGLVISKAKYRRFDFIMSVYSECQAIVDRMSSFINGMGMKKLAVADSYVADLSRLLFLASDFMAIDIERIRLDPEPIDIIQFFHRTVKDFAWAEKNVSLQINNTIPRIIFIDRKRLQQIMMAIMKALGKTNAVLDIDYVDYSSSQNRGVFLVMTLIPKGIDVNFAQRFRVEHLSVESLELSICQRLCELLSGTYEVKSNNLIIKLKVDTYDDTKHEKKDQSIW